MCISIAPCWTMALSIVVIVLLQQGWCQGFDPEEVNRVSGTIGEGFSARQDYYTIRESIGRVSIDVTNYFVDAENFEIADSFVVKWHLEQHPNASYTATPGVDVTPTNGTIVFSKRKSVRTINLFIETNDEIEKDESFILRLASTEKTALPHLNEYTTVKIVQDEKCFGLTCTTNAVCGNLTCDCKDGYVGDARFSCVDPAKHHLCIEYGDPQIQPMGDHAFYKLLLPCEHRILETETESGCTLIINGASTDATYEDKFVIKLENVNVTIIKDYQLTYLAISPHGTEFSDKIAMKFSRNDEGYLNIVLPDCNDVTIKYRAQDGTVVVELPKHTYLPVGACMPVDAPEAPASKFTVRSPRGEDVVEMFLHSLHEVHSFNPGCKNISATASFCKNGNWFDMAAVCGQFTFETSGSCLSKEMDREQFLDIINRCIDDICQNDILPCDAIAKYLTATNPRCDITYVMEDYGCKK